MVTVRHAVEDDADAIYKVHVSSIRRGTGGHYSAAEIEEWSGRQNTDRYKTFIRRSEIYVAEKEGSIIGFGHIDLTEGCEMPNRLGQIRGLYVVPEEMGRGFGKVLLCELVDVAKKHGSQELTVLSTVNSVGFYKRQGFELQGEEHHTVGNSLSLKCFAMKKTL
eukprot:m.47350 g.47350  ORF g.47350 m.47350 type:complete len:164 (+) comp33775_c0_seq1:186-677(+)